MDDDKPRPVTPRPVSGEIMSAGAARGQRPRESGDVSDAHYETVSPAQGTAAPARFGEGAAESESPATGMDFLKHGAAKTEGRARRGGALFWGLGLFLVALAFWVSGGHALLTSGPAPDTATKTPLAIADVKSRIETHGGRAVLFVEGRAANDGGATLALPPIEIAVTANDGGVARYRLAATDTELKPGDRYSFSSRLDAPASGVRTVAVAFQEDER
jgi:hypothetical protein